MRYENLGDICTTVTDYVANGSFKSLKENVSYESDQDGYAILIRLVDYRNNFKGPFQYIDKHGYEYLKKTKLFGNEIIISNVGAHLGTVFRAPRLNFPMSLGPNAIVIDTKYNNDYYYYFFISNRGQALLQSIVSGSAQPKFNKTEFKSLLVPVPSLTEQTMIANRLLVIDKKIRNNNQVNDNLDELLTTIFEEKVNSPKFSQRNLTDIANYRNGLAMQKFRPDNDQESMPVLKIKELNQGYTDGTSDRCSANIDPSVIVKIGDIIFSWSGTLLVKNWSGKTAGLNQHLFKVTSENYPDWFIYEWTKHHLRRFQSIAAGKATTMGHIKRKDLKDSTVYIPDNSYLTELDRRMKPIYNKRLEIIKENQELNNLRQALLQKYF